MKKALFLSIHIISVTTAAPAKKAPRVTASCAPKLSGILLERHTACFAPMTLLLKGQITLHALSCNLPAE